MQFYRSLQYRWLKFQVYCCFNFGKGDFGCTQFFDLRIVPKHHAQSEIALSNHFNTFYCYSVGPYYVLLDERGPWER